MNKFAVRSSQFLICLMFYFSLNAQWTCDFDSQNWIEPELNNSNFNTETLQHTFMVLYHIVRMSNGTGGTTLSQLANVHAKLNSNYNPFKIYFTQLCDVDYIDSDSFYYNSLIRDLILSVNFKPNVINIYLFPKVQAPPPPGPPIDESAGGYSTLINTSGYPAFWVGDDNSKEFNSYFVTTNVVSHEMGHIFGLLHTHHEYDFPLGSASVDWVNNPDCSEFGDYCCDTPPDPKLSDCLVTNNCVYQGKIFGTGTFFPLDKNGIPFAPDPTNIMSYGPTNCLANFSTEQGARANYIITQEQLQNGLNSKIIGLFQNYNVSGNTLLTTQTINGSITVLAGATLTLKDKTFSFTPNSSILVERGGKLIIDNSILTKACKDRWQGIIVQGNNGLAQIDPNNGGTLNLNSNGVITMKNNSILEESNYGMVAGYAFNTSNIANSFFSKYGGGLIKCSNSIIRNNLQAAKFYPYNKIFENKSEFINVLVLRSDLLISNCTGVEIIGTKEIEFNNTIFSSMLGTALSIIDASAWVHGGYSSFSRNTTAIDIKSSGPLSSSLTVRGEPGTLIQFYNNNAHIRANAVDGFSTNTAGLEVIYCKFSGVNKNMTPYITGSSNFYVFGNTIESCNVFGTVVINSGDGFNRIRCNNYNNMGSQVDINVIGNASSLQIGNNIFNQSTNLNIRTFNANFPDQGDADLAAGNCFTSVAQSIKCYGNTPQYYTLLNNSINYLPCMAPNNGTDGVFLQYSNIISTCAVAKPGLNASLGTYLQSIADRDSLKTLLDSNPSNSTLKNAYRVAKDTSVVRFDYLYQKEIQDGNYFNALNLTQIDTIQYVKRRAYGHNLLYNNTSASTSLSAIHFPYESTDTFTMVQAINIARITDTAFVLSYPQQMLLCQVAVRETTAGANASALLALFGIKEDSCGHVMPREADFKPKVVGVENTVLYPNPTTGILHINSELLHFAQPLIISILKTDGSIISIHKNEANMSIDISDLPNGLYFVRINDKVSTSTYKIFKL